MHDAKKASLSNQPTSERDKAFKKWFFEDNRDISKDAVDCCHLAFNAGWAARQKELDLDEEYYIAMTD